MMEVVYLKMDPLVILNSVQWNNVSNEQSFWFSPKLRSLVQKAAVVFWELYQFISFPWISSCLNKKELLYARVQRGIKASPARVVFFNLYNLEDVWSSTPRVHQSVWKSIDLQTAVIKKYCVKVFLSGIQNLCTQNGLRQKDKVIMMFKVEIYEHLWRIACAFPFHYFLNNDNLKRHATNYKCNETTKRRSDEG